jgi:hypothetical protein
MWEWKEVAGYEVISFLDVIKYCHIEFVDYNKFIHWTVYDEYLSADKC